MLIVRKANKFYGAGIGKTPIKNKKDFRAYAANSFTSLGIPPSYAYTYNIKHIAHLMCLDIL